VSGARDAKKIKEQTVMTETAAPPVALVLFGGNGDLATRMLLPSLYFLERDGLLPANVTILLVARSIGQGEAVVAQVREHLRHFVAAEFFDEAAWTRFAARLDGLALDATCVADFAPLARRLVAANERIFYLATSPALYGPICRNLRDAGLAGAGSRVVLEKPIGHDLASSRIINQAVAAAFEEAAIFRVDHYLGKETVQNLLALRFANFLFEPLWSARGIEHVQITVSETVGVEGRWSYYDASGAMRDMLQNHMLQLLCLVAMEAPVSMDPDAVRDEKLKVLRSLKPIRGRDVAVKTVRGQYTAGAIDGRPVPGYAQEVGAPQEVGAQEAGAQEVGGESMTETFVALKAEIDNWRWAGVPFYLRTGKRLPTRYSEIFIQFRPVPHSIFTGPADAGLAANKLIIRLQPQETIRLMVMNKVPGLDQAGIRLHELPLDLSRTEADRKQRQRIAYERLLLDVINNVATLFVRRDEVEAAWAWADDILAGWRASGQPPRSYVTGSWGPSAAIALAERSGHSWHE
jgi:glucose-6-phosphate 1-dehydrogenase